MKLEIGKTYSVTTLENYYGNVHVTILGWISYEEATKYSNMVQNVSINEKVIDKSGDTGTLLLNTIYYKCKVISTDNSQHPYGETLILWDDILDMTKTYKLNENYLYNFNFTINDSSTVNITKDELIDEISDFLTNKTGLDITFSFEEIISYESMNTENRLELTENLLDKSNETLKALTDMQTSAEIITETFTSNDINAKMNSLSENIDVISDNVNTIISRLQ